MRLISCDLPIFPPKSLQKTNYIPCDSRFVDKKEDIVKLRKCFAGLWSLDDSDIVSKAIEKPELFVMKPQREGGGSIFSALSLFFSFFLRHILLIYLQTAKSIKL